MRIRVLLCTAIAGFVALSLSACSDDVTQPDLLAPDGALARYGNGGGGPGGGNGGGGGPPEEKNKKGDLYADLVYLLRTVDGLPILREIAGEHCLQPIALAEVDGATETVNAVDGKTVWVLPLMGDLDDLPVTEEEEVGACDVQPEFVEFMAEVPFGRLNLGRAPVSVLNQALAEVLVKMRAAGSILLDHAGRLSPDDVTIDAPAENLAIHREMQVAGGIGVPDEFALPVPFEGYGMLDHAATGLGAAADKTGRVSADMIIYNNRILGIPDAITSGPLSTITGNGTIGEDGERYVDYGGYDYTRSTAFPGCVIYSRIDGLTVLPPVKAYLLDVVPWTNTLVPEGSVEPHEFVGSNIYAFAQRADDARAVIQFAHDNIVLGIDRIGESSVCDATLPGDGGEEEPGA